MKKPVKIVYHPAYENGYITASCETPDRVGSIVSALKGRYEFIEPEPCTEHDILLCHSEGIIYAEKTDPFRYETALLAAGGAVLACELALDGIAAFAAVRPPGHHASPGSNWGFCFFNNISIAVKRALEKGLINSAVILDIDLHFGDGTENIFEFDKRVQVLNIQSSTPVEFIRETRSALNAVSRADVVAVSAGFDQYEKDWGGNLSTEDYREIGRIASLYADEKCGGKIFAVLEGGYYIPDLGANALALIEGISEND
jgi:acetoin utilization deacetylase AcuC-like enzyme